MYIRRRIQGHNRQFLQHGSAVLFYCFGKKFFSEISSTQIYSKLINQKIKDVYKKAHPRA